MKCKDDAEVTDAITSQGLKIDSIHLLKFGTISIADSEPDEDSEQPYTDRRENASSFTEDDGLEISQKLSGVIESHPNVFDFKLVGPDYPPGEYLSDAGKLLHGPIYRGSVHLPKKQQKYQDMDCDEHFSIRICGTYFAAVAKVDRLAAYSNMAHEFREIFRSRVIEKTPWKAPLIGPCPVHEDFFVIGVSASDSSVQTFPLLYWTGNDLFVVVNRDNIAETIQGLFVECLIYLSRFYELTLARVELIYLDSEIQIRMEKLAKAHKGFATAPVWRFREVNGYLAEARDHLAYIYELRVMHSRQDAQYKRDRRRYLDNLRESTMLYPIRGSMKTETIMDVELPDTLLPWIQFFQAQADAKRGAYSLLVASLVGALIGGFVTLVVTLAHIQK